MASGTGSGYRQRRQERLLTRQVAVGAASGRYAGGPRAEEPMTFHR
jgi:hypothetical protein